MINPKILFIVFGVITCASVTSLILYDQYESSLEWQEKGGPLLTTDGSAMLEKVLDYCEATKNGEAQFAYGISFDNGTHYIDNNTCEWLIRDLPIYPGMATLPDTYDEDFTDDFEIDYTEKFD